jgi:hypothetical protein
VRWPDVSAQQAAAAEALSEESLPCPAQGLELSIVATQVAQHPAAEAAFELHLATAPEDTKVLDGHHRSGDPDLVLHFAVCRKAGRLVGPGPPAVEVFGPVADDLVLAQLLSELASSPKCGVPGSGTQRSARSRLSNVAGFGSGRVVGSGMRSACVRRADRCGASCK